MIFRLVLVALAATYLVSAWNCDDRCPDYNACLEEERQRGNRRALDGGGVWKHKTSTSLLFLSAETQLNGRNDGNHRDTVGSGNGSKGNNMSKRPTVVETQQNLRGVATSMTTRFLLRMYHEESTEYCWQSEWEDRGWCMECEECESCGSVSCDEGDSLWIKFCNDDQDEQYFVYEEVSGTGGGRLKPYTAQSLCLEKTGSRAMVLKTCQDGNMDQILMGFAMSGAFELYPYGHDTASTSSPKCLSQAHHPKKEEEIEAFTCDSARGDKTSLWIATEVIVSGNLNACSGS